MLKPLTLVAAIAALFTILAPSVQAATPGDQKATPTPTPRVKPQGRTIVNTTKDKFVTPSPSPTAKTKTVETKTESKKVEGRPPAPTPTPTPRKELPSPSPKPSPSPRIDKASPTPKPTPTPPKVDGRPPAPSPTATPRSSAPPRAAKGSIRVSGTKDRVTIVLDLASPQAFAYNPATGAIEPTSGDIQAAVSGLPIPGIGVVVRKHPGGKSITIPTSGGKGELPTDAEAGTYDLMVSIPQTGADPVVITFAMTKGPDGWTHKKGSGSPHQQGFKNATAAAVVTASPSASPQNSSADQGWEGKVQRLHVVSAVKLTFDKQEDHDNFAAGKLKINLALKNTRSGQTIRFDSKQLSERYPPMPGQETLKIQVVIDNMSTELTETSCFQVTPSAEHIADGSGLDLTLSYSPCASGQPQQSAGTPIGGLIVKGGKNPGGNLSIAGETRVVTKEAAANLSSGPGTIVLNSSKGNGSLKAAGF